MQRTLDGFKARRLDVLDVLSYEITWSNFRAKYPYLSDHDFEDRIQDTFERFIKYYQVGTLNPLTAFNTMWRTWAGSNAERRREVHNSSIISFYDPEDPEYTGVAYEDDGFEDNLMRLYRRIKGQLNDKCKAVFLLSQAGYSITEVADELRTSRQTCELYKNHVTVLLAREAGMTKELSRLEVRNAARNEALKKQHAAKKVNK